MKLPLIYKCHTSNIINVILIFLNFRVYTVARPQPRGIFGWSYFIILFPFRFVYTSVLDILRFACKFSFITLIYKCYHKSRWSMYYLKRELWPECHWSFCWLDDFCISDRLLRPDPRRSEFYDNLSHIILSHITSTA